MSLYPATVLERSTLTFCAASLHPRDELLFKAFVRLLDHLTHHHWRYQAPADGVTIDLLVIADGTLAEYRGPKAAQCLQLGANGSLQPGFLHWPLKSDALEKELNRVGGQILAGHTRPSPTTWSAGRDFGAVAHVGTQATSMRLRQWPPADLLTGAGRMRLATLLTGKAITLHELAERSKLPLAQCGAFVGDLQRAKLLVGPGNPPGPIQHLTGLAPKSLQAGLLARIRLSLGIF